MIRSLIPIQWYKKLSIYIYMYIERRQQQQAVRCVFPFLSFTFARSDDCSIQLDWLYHHIYIVLCEYFVHPLVRATSPSTAVCVCWLFVVAAQWWFLFFFSRFSFVFLFHVVCMTVAACCWKISVAFGCLLLRSTVCWTKIGTLFHLSLYFAKFPVYIRISYCTIRTNVLYEFS